MCSDCSGHHMQNGPHPTVTKQVFSLHCSQIDKEAVALIFAVKNFHQYVHETHFVVYADHQTLLDLYGENKSPSLKEPFPVSSGGP